MEGYQNMRNSPWISIKFEGENFERLTHNMVSVLYKANKLIVDLYSENSDIYVIDSGSVQISLSSLEGSKKTVMFASRGNLIAEISAILETPANISAKALEDSYVYVIPCEEFKLRLEENPPLLWSFIKQLATKGHILMSQIEMLTFSRPLDRVKKTLYWIFKEFGEETVDGIRVNSRITHQDIAYITGLSRVSVSNAFWTMYKEETLTKKDGFLYIKSIAELSS